MISSLFTATSLLLLIVRYASSPIYKTAKVVCRLIDSGQDTVLFAELQPF